MPNARLVIWSDDECKRIHEATLKLLAETGIEVKYAPAREIFARAGARVDGTRVRIQPDLVAAALASAPRSWLLKPRGGATEPLVLDAAHSYFGTGSDVLYISDPDTHERRRVVKADVEGQAALCERLPDIDFVMSMGLPSDVRSRPWTICRRWTPWCAARASRCSWRPGTGTSCRGFRRCAPWPAKRRASASMPCPRRRFSSMRTARAR